MVWWRRKEGIQLASYAEVANQVGADDKAVRGGVACGAVTVGALVIHVFSVANSHEEDLELTVTMVDPSHTASIYAAFGTNPTGSSYMYML